MQKENIEHWFKYHPPTQKKLRSYENIRHAAKEFAMVIFENTPSSADQTAAIRKIREAVMTANAALACDGK